MAKPKRDPVREERIHEEIIVDAYGPEEQAMSWYYYLEDKIQLPVPGKVHRFRSNLSACERANLSSSEVWRLKIPARATCSC